MATQKDTGQYTFKQQLMLRARQLRREPTPAEKLLWERLRDRQIAGLNFRRQQPLLRFIADFFCAGDKLVVEVDGDVHKQRGPEDALRDDILEAGGIQVLRFPNAAVLQDADKVIEQIKQYAEVRKRQLVEVSPSPRSRRGVPA